MLDIRILENSYFRDSLSACDSYAWRGNMYTETGLYRDTIDSANVLGCDSVLELVLVLSSSTRFRTNIVECDAYIFNGKSYDSTGFYRDTVTNYVGCDSVLELNLQIYRSSVVTVHTIITCDSVYPWRGGMFSMNGLYRDSLLNVLGCDSVLELSLQIDWVDVSVLRADSTLMVYRDDNASYRWFSGCEVYSLISGATANSYMMTSNGDYAVEVSKGGCIDTSSCYTVLNLSVDALRDSDGLEVQVYPSPTEGEVFIDLGVSYERVFVVVRDVFGRVLEDRVYTDVSLINTRIEGGSGIYYIEVSDAFGNRGVFRVVKE